MTIGDLRALISDLPDDSDVEIFNSSCEWYGRLSVKSGQIAVKDAVGW